MEDGWDKFYGCIVEETYVQVHDRLDLFRVSLGDWLYGQLNWPTDDWQQQLDLLVEHTRYYGLEIESECIGELHDLVEARVNRTGAFAVLAENHGEQTGDTANAPIQVALGVTLDDGTRSDTTIPLGPTPPDQGPKQTMKGGREVAGPGPTTTRSFRDQGNRPANVVDPTGLATYGTFDITMIPHAGNSPGNPLEAITSTTIKWRPPAGDDSCACSRVGFFQIAQTYQRAEGRLWGEVEDFEDWHYDNIRWHARVVDYVQGRTTTASVTDDPGVTPVYVPA